MARRAGDNHLLRAQILRNSAAYYRLESAGEDIGKYAEDFQWIRAKTTKGRGGDEFPV
jgi:hypothetical protein